MKSISNTKLKEILDNGDIALFDVRGDVLYEQEHIPGAKTAPLGSLVFRVARLMNPESRIVVYSNENNDDLAKQAVSRLTNLGLTNVHYLVGGLGGWKGAGYRTEMSVKAKLHTHGPAVDCRPVIVDRENAYGGAFKGDPVNTESAGG